MHIYIYVNLRSPYTPRMLLLFCFQFLALRRLSELEQVCSQLSLGKSVGRVKWELHLLLLLHSVISCCLVYFGIPEKSNKGERKLQQLLSLYFSFPSAPVRRGEVSQMFRQIQYRACCMCSMSSAFPPCESQGGEGAEPLWPWWSCSFFLLQLCPFLSHSSSSQQALHPHVCDRAVEREREKGGACKSFRSHTHLRSWCEI